MRKIKVSSISFPAAEPKKFFSTLDNYLFYSFAEKPDIICLPEIFHLIGVKNPLRKPLDVPNEITDFLGEKALKNNCYIICPILEKDKNGNTYNSSLLINRKGQIVCSYHKIYPTIGEIENGIMPGKEPIVIDTDFGRIGFVICFDLNFREIFEEMAKKNVEIVFFSSMFSGGSIINCRALEFSIFIVSSLPISLGPTESSVIVNPLGKTIKFSSLYEPVITAEINLDYCVCHLDYNHLKFKKLKKKYGNLVDIEVSSPEGIFCLYSNHPEKTVKEIIEEFKIETRKDYFNRAREIRERTLK